MRRRFPLGQRGEVDLPRRSNSVRVGLRIRRGWAMGQPPCVRARSLEEGLPITLAAADRGQPGRQPLAVAGGTALRPGAQGAFDTQTDVTDAEGCRHATTGSMARESDWLTGRRRVPMRGADARGTTRECHCATVALAEADVENMYATKRGRPLPGSWSLFGADPLG